MVMFQSQPGPKAPVLSVILLLVLESLPALACCDHTFMLI